MHQFWCVQFYKSFEWVADKTLSAVSKEGEGGGGWGE
jgi:hypothetical protein